jgi:hypothetical protein
MVAHGTAAGVNTKNVAQAPEIVETILAPLETALSKLTADGVPGIPNIRPLGSAKSTGSPTA